MFLLLVGLGCLFPLALYCLFLALLHYRRRPTMLSGPWDFAGVLVGLSGFLLVGGTTLLFAFHTAARESWLQGSTLADLRRGHAQSGTITFVLWGLYFLVLVLGSVYLLWQRSDYTVIYNVTPDELESILGSVLDSLGLAHLRRGSRLYVGYGPVSGGLALKPEKAAFDAAAPAGDPLRKAVIDLDGSSLMRTVVLHWDFAAHDLRRELEAELAHDLTRYDSSPGPTGGWFLTAAGSLMLMMIFVLGTFFLINMRKG